MEIAHGMDTNINESFNNAATWFVPNNKVYSGSVSRIVRLSLAIGIQSVGLEANFNRLFVKLGIVVTKNMLHYLKVQVSKCAKRLTKIKINKQRKVPATSPSSTS
jgi:hypothetical protein